MVMLSALRADRISLMGMLAGRRRSTGACASMLARVYVKNRYIRVLDYHVEESWGSARKKAL